MGSTSDEVKIVKALELVLRSEVEHLIQGMGEVEGRSDKDIRVLPICWGEDRFLDEVFAEVLHVGFFDHAINDLLRISLLFGFPIVTMACVNGWNEKVELRVSGRGDRGIGDAGISNVDRHILRNRLPLKDLI